MSNEPKTIYLQIGEEADINEFKEGDFEKGGISWCWERIFNNDIEYISKQSILTLVDEISEEVKSIKNRYREDYPARPYLENEIHRLWKLKQKIEAL